MIPTCEAIVFQKVFCVWVKRIFALVEALIQFARSFVIPHRLRFTGYRETSKIKFPVPHFRQSVINLIVSPVSLRTKLVRQFTAVGHKTAICVLHFLVSLYKIQSAFSLAIK